MSIDYTQGPGSVAAQIINDEYAKSVRERAKLLADSTGEEMSVCERYVKQLDYRARYNSKPEVQAKRKEYNRKRQAEMKAFRQLVASDPELQERLKGGR